MKPQRIIPVMGSVLLLAGTLAVSDESRALDAYASSKTTHTKTAAGRPAVVGGPGLTGTLISASRNVLKIRVMPTHRSATITLTSKTAYVVNGKSTKTRPAWKKGEQIQAMGKKAKSGAYTAAAVMVGRPPANGRPGGPPPTNGQAPGAPLGGAAPVSGSVVSSSGSSLVVKTSKGETTFALTSKTRYLVQGKARNSRPTFKVGEQVHVVAAKSGSVLTAHMVIIGAVPVPPAGGPPPAGSGSSG